MRAFALLGAIFVLAGCMPRTAEIERDPHADEVERALASARAQVSTTGSLWSGGAGLLADPKASHVGDLVTVLIREDARAKRSVDMTKDKKSSHSTGINAFLGLEKALAAKNKNFTPSAALDVVDQRSFKGAGGTASSDQLIAAVTAVITKVYPNGTMRIVGRKLVTINHQPQVIRFTGIIRRSDIGPDNTIPSSKVAQAEIFYGGGGELAAGVHEGWLSRTLEQLWPF